MTDVALTGAKGRMGSLIIDEIRSSPDLKLVAAIDIIGIGDRVLGDVCVSDARDVQRVLRESRPDVLIDFTVPSAALENIHAAADTGVALVVGTTGFSEEQLSIIEEMIKSAGIAAVISPNFSLGVNVFWKLVEMAARSLSDYDVEVIEAHHRKKKDAPSGTAMRTVEILSRSLGIEDVRHGREGMCERGREIGVHAVRAGDIVGDHTVLFAGPGERIEIKHQAHSRSAFARGALRAARWVVKAPPGIHSMEEVLASS
ncbi:MAG: 4-hydroxy-tetrahydrodipicolinate reductase [Methanothrix sp.]|jgi:dihydrodipicolinate reductase (EC 1.3.1.26)|uniref:4-hydroxy-tetrahydrodipicolinate reductase n=1 Tax=Methanothrix thermoacetophila (strain DSM 6194 / JCM 14653 / NBRC 101360 / PT) TaxID=349307 RepID=A0B7E0_METTP|nr:MULTISPECIES: 4-hydroxy-tetrahydrodipicolinate reductase [Methanothrix]ABK14614.1 dihydrodipicolinate reductase [Methanothrix thermoacetophila PT]MBC7079116.1 4-hydroxy-tetrahydrodipicolinate reductase [Methanothrix sp.]NPU87272.1 4-hydroxy-tetrahydrodipicolinate reductase [Methanothrix sp.]